MGLCVCAAFSAPSTKWRQVVVQTCKMLPYRIRRNSVPLADHISRLFISSCFLSFSVCVCLYLCGADRFLTVLRFCLLHYDLRSDCLGRFWFVHTRIVVLLLVSFEAHKSENQTHEFQCTSWWRTKSKVQCMAVVLARWYGLFDK